MSELSVVVATFGSASWSRLALERACPSVEAPAQLVRVHGRSLAEARNEGLRQVETEWVVFLDADDELEAGYAAAMLAGDGDLRVPQVRYPPRPASFPRVVGHDHTCSSECLTEGNWIVIGAAVRTEMVREVGGFKPWPWCEDWDLWCRCWRAGADICRVPEAIYRAHVRPGSRNRRGTPRALRQSTYQAIRRANFPELVV